MRSDDKSDAGGEDLRDAGVFGFRFVFMFLCFVLCSCFSSPVRSNSCDVIYAGGEECQDAMMVLCCPALLRCPAL